jgi:hypothetical protein
MAVTGTFIGDFSSFQTAVDQSDVKIRQFETNSSKVATTLDRVANSFSGRKIIQEATLMAAAIEKGGGEARLTATELERAGRVAQEAAEKMRALGIAVPASIDKLAQSSKEAGGFMQDLGNHVLATAAGMVTAEAAIQLTEKAFDTLEEFVSSSVEAYAKQELAAKRVATALKVQGDASADVISEYKELSNAVQEHSTFSHTDIEATEALLIQVGDIQPKQMKKALQATTDLASGLGVDLHAATLLIGKAFEGNTATLGRYGIVLDQARVKAEGITYVLDELERKFGGQAQAEAETYSGKIKQMGNDWEDFKEKVGEAIVKDEAVIEGLKYVKEAIVGVKTASDEGLPSVVAFIAGMASPEAKVAIEVWSALHREVRTLDDDIKNLAPPPPKQFSGFTADIDESDAKMKQFAEDTAKGWEYIEKTREAAEKKHEKEEEEKNKKFESEQAEFDKLVAESNKLRIEQGGTARDVEIANIRAAEQAEIESLTRRGQANASNIALIHENADRAIKGLGLDWKALADQSLDTARQQRDDALETYEYMLAHADQYTREALDKQLAKYRELADAATATGRAAADAQDAAAAAAKRHNDELDKQKKKEEDAAAAAKKNREQGGSFEVTAANFDQYTAPSGIQKSSVLNLLKQGFSMENALAILQAAQRGAAVDLSKWPEDARGPRVPGFRLGVERFSGGPAVVGEDGPELVDLPAGASVTPLGTARSRPAFGLPDRERGPAVVNVNVSGVFDPNSRSSLENVVSKELAGKVFGGRR